VQLHTGATCSSCGLYASRLQSCGLAPQAPTSSQQSQVSAARLCSRHVCVQIYTSVQLWLLRKFSAELRPGTTGTHLFTVQPG
jgi:hypothetical protein